MQPRHVPTWDQHPSLLVTHQYSRCIERLLQSLPSTVQRQAGPSLILAIGRIRAGIAAAHPAQGRRLGPHMLAPALCREEANSAVATSAATLELLRRERLGSRAELLVALELLERIESALVRKQA